jgi:internalin A
VVSPILGDYLTNLESLSLAGNELISIPNSFSNLLNLRDLKLNENFLEHIPHKLTKLPSLTRLSLKNNRISIILAIFGAFSVLEWLDISKNQIKMLPHQLFDGCKAHLQSLFVAHNQLLLLPVNIGVLQIAKLNS